MADVTVNDMTGEVSFSLGDVPMRLHATMPRLADYQSRMNVTGLGALMKAVISSDARALYFGVKCLCSSGNAEKVDTMLLGPHMETLVAAITKAVMGGIPEAEPGKPDAKG